MKVFEKSSLLSNLKLDAQKTMRSVSAEASRAIYYFPVLTSKSISGDAAALAVNNIENAYASFVRSCFAMFPAMAVKGKIVNVEDYLKMFHQNIGLSNSNYQVTIKESAEEYSMFSNKIINEAISPKELEHKMSQNTNVMTEAGKDDNGSMKTIEKKNSMTPTITPVDISFIIEGQLINTVIPIGIKATLHPANPNEINEQIIDSISGKTGIFHNLIRYSTGEVMSLKDIIFGTNKMKKNLAKKSTSEMAVWSDAIEHRKRINKLPLGFLGKKPFLPNVTIMVSMDDIHTIQRTVGFNLYTDAHRAIRFMKDNFLLAFAIIDEANDTFYILYDGQSRYDEFPFATLKRQSDKSHDANNVVFTGMMTPLK